MNIVLNEEDTRDLQACLMFALRYAIGRKTYAFGLVSSFIIDHADIMQKWQLNQMGEKIEQDIMLWNLQEWEVNHYREVAIALKELADDDGSRESVKKQVEG